jgi:hypothetical protein
VKRGKVGGGTTYLKPLLSTTITALEIPGTLVHPHHHRPLLMRPLAPNRLDLAACSDLGAEVCGCAAVTHDLLVGDGHGGVVVGPLALDRLGGRGR